MAMHQLPPQGIGRQSALVAAPAKKASLETMFKHKPMTFEDIDKLSLNQFSNKGTAAFRPADILDIDPEDDSEDEILKKFKSRSP